MKKRYFRRLTAAVLAIVMALGTLGMIPAFAAVNDYLNNKNFIISDPDDVTAKKDRGDKFICVVCQRTCSNSQMIGDSILTTWMNDYGEKLYGIVVAEGEGGKIPFWIYDAAGVGDNEILYTPAIVFVENKNAVAFTGKNDKTLEVLSNAFSQFRSIEEKKITGISVKTEPDKTLYLPGEAFSYSGLVLECDYSDGSSGAIYTGFTCDPGNMNEEGIKKVKITYKGFTTEQEIIVSNSQNYSVSCKFHQTDARSMFDSINKLRINDPWYWNEDNKTKTRPKLSPVVYDYGLEQSAMQRAVEISLYYSHTRTDGRKCFTAIDGAYGTAAENIAYGYTDANEMFRAWEQKSEYYEKQAHRRNMLSPDVAAVGIACASIIDSETGTEIKFWVQVFSSTPSNTAKTTPLDSKVTTSITLLNTLVKDITYTSTESIYTLGCDEKAPLPKLTASAKLEKTEDFSYDLRYDLVPECIWEAGNKSLVSVSGGKVCGKMPGETVIKTLLAGRTVEIPVIVENGGETITLSSDVSSYNIKAGEKADLPGITAKIVFPSSKTVILYPTAQWKSDNSAVASVSGGMLTGIKEGKTNIRATISGETLVIPVTVSGKVPGGGNDEPDTPGGTNDPIVPGGNDEPVVPGGNDDPVVPGGNDDPVVPGGNDDPVVPDEPDIPDTPIPTIKIPALKPVYDVDLKSTVIFSAKVTDRPKDSVIRWYVNGSYSGKTGDTFTITKIAAESTVYAQLCTPSGAKLCESNLVSVRPSGGFLAVIIAFFRGLFNSLPTINIK